MRLPVALLLLTLTLGSLHVAASQRHYDDDTTPRKVRLEDLEIEVDERQLEQLKRQKFLQRQQQNLQRQQHQKQQQLQQQQLDQQQQQQQHHERIQQQHQRPFFPTDQGPPADFELGPRPAFDYNELSHQATDRDANGDRESGENYDDESRSPANAESYALQSAVVLVPPFGADASSDERHQQQQQEQRIRHQQQQHLLLLRPQQIQLQQQQLQLPQQQVQQQQQQQQIQQQHRQPHSLRGFNFASPGVHYRPLTSNSLAEPESESLLEPVVRRPALEYGTPLVRRPQPPPPPPPGSNQHAYAPRRPESSTLSAGSATFPYPPSFISITTRRPEIFESPVFEERAPIFEKNATPFITAPATPSFRPSPPSFASATPPFRPSPLSPVPDPFARRHPKSLLDSYIPSWVVSAMQRQRSASQSPSTSLSRHFKRSPNPEAERRVVKKSLPLGVAGV